MGKEPNTAVSEPKKGIISSALGFLGRLAVAPGKMLIYPVWPMKVIRSVEVTWPIKFTLPLVAYPENWSNSFGEIGHDFKEGLRGLIKMPPKKYDKPIGMSQGTKYFSVIITSNRKDHEEGVVIFEGSKVFIGDIPYLTNEQLKEIEAKLPNISISREKNEVVIEINVKQVVTNHELLKEIRDEYGSNISEEAIKKLAIVREIERNFKELAKITGGELGKDIDPKFVYDTAGKLLSKHIEEEKKSAEVVTPKQSINSSEKIVTSSPEKSSEVVIPEQGNKLPEKALKNVGKELAEVMSVSPQSENTEQLEKSSGVVTPMQSNKPPEMVKQVEPLKNQGSLDTLEHAAKGFAEKIVKSSKGSPGALKHSGTGFAETVLSSEKGDKENKLKGV